MLARQKGRHRATEYDVSLPRLDGAALSAALGHIVRVKNQSIFATLALFLVSPCAALVLAPHGIYSPRLMLGFNEYLICPFLGVPILSL